MNIIVNEDQQNLRKSQTPSGKLRNYQTIQKNDRKSNSSKKNIHLKTSPSLILNDGLNADNNHNVRFRENQVVKDNDTNFNKKNFPNSFSIKKGTFYGTKNSSNSLKKTQNIEMDRYDNKNEVGLENPIYNNNKLMRKSQSFNAKDKQLNLISSSSVLIKSDPTGPYRVDLRKRSQIEGKSLNISQVKNNVSVGG